MAPSRFLKTWKIKRLRDSKTSSLRQLIGQKLEQLAFISFLGAICIFAFIEGRPDDLSRSFLAVLMCVCGLLRVLGSAIRGTFSIAFPRLLLPLAGISLLAIVQIAPLSFLSYLHSEDPFETKSFIVVFTALIITVESLSYLVSNTRRLYCLTGVCIAVGVGSAIYGITRASITPSAEQYAQFVNRNHYALLAEMSTGLLIGLLINGRLSQLTGLIGWLLTGVLTYSLLTAGSRGGIVGFFGIIIFSLIIRTFSPPSSHSERDLGRTRWASRSRKVLGVGAASLLAAIISLAAITLVGGDRVVSRLEQVGSEVESSSPMRMNRGTIWNITFDLIKDRPITGVGFGAYSAAITRFDRSNGSWELDQAHNDYLEILANGGIVGFALLGCFAVLAGRRAFCVLGSDDMLIRSACFGAVVGIIGVLIHSLVDFGLHVPLNAGVMAALVAIATYRPHIGASSNSNQNTLSFRDGAGRWLVPFFYTVLILVVGFYAGRQALSEKLANSAMATNSISKARLAARISDADPNVQIALGLLHLDGLEYNEAILAFSRATDQAPKNYRVWQLLGSARYTAGDLAGAQGDYLKAISLAPNYSRPRYMYGMILLQNGREREGFIALSEAAENDFGLYPQIIDLAAKFYPNNALAIERAARPKSIEARTFLARYFIRHSLMSNEMLSFLFSDELNVFDKNDLVGELIGQREYPLARKLWATTISPDSLEGGPIFDGGFEHTKGADQGEFGWQIDQEISGVQISRTQHEPHSGSYALHIRFSGSVALGRSILTQLVCVRPKTSYQLRFHYRSPELLSASNPVIIVTDPSQGLELGRSLILTANGDKWNESSIDFTSNNTSAVRIALARPACSSMPCPIFGEVSLDDFSIVER